MKKWLSLILVSLILSESFLFGLTPQGTVISNGGISPDNNFDQPGETLLSYDAYSGTITCSAVTSTVSQGFGALSATGSYLNESLAQAEEKFYLYQTSNTGNGNDFFALAALNSGGRTASLRVLSDDNQDNIHNSSETAVISGLSLSPAGSKSFYIAVRVPEDMLQGEVSTVTVRITANNGAGQDDGWGASDIVIDTIVITCVDLSVPAIPTGFNAAPGPDSGMLNLSWTVPGDDGTVGKLTVSQFAVRYSSAVLSEAEWQNSAAVTRDTVTLTGINQAYVLSGLNPGVTYYTRIAVRDEVAGHWSALSAVATSWTLIDNVTPGVVTDLSAFAGINEGEIRLAWSAPGDDGSAGVAALYLVKYATFQFSNGEFDLSPSVTDVSILSSVNVPRAAGLSENLTVSGLAPGATFYFALKARDENPAGWSGLSNVVSAYALPDLIAPAIVTDLYAGVVSTSEITLSWTFTGDNGISGSLSGGGYELRYSTSVEDFITGFSSLSGLNVAISTPVFAGGRGTAVFSNFQTNTTYYFRLRIYDKAMNLSALSNAATGYIAQLVLPVDTTPPVAPALSIPENVKIGGDSFVLFVSSEKTEITQVKYEIRETGATAYYQLSVSTVSPFMLNYTITPGATWFIEGKVYEILATFSDSPVGSGSSWSASSVSTKTVTVTVDNAKPDVISKSIDSVSGAAVTVRQPDNSFLEIVKVSSEVAAALPALSTIIVHDTTSLKTVDSALINKIDSANLKLDPALSGQDKNIGIKSFEIVSATGGIVSGHFSGFVKIRIPYPDKDNDGIVDGTEVSERTLKIYRLNENTNTWEQVIDTLDSGNRGENRDNYIDNYVSADVRHFSVYSILGANAPFIDNLVAAKVKVFPNPYRGKAYSVDGKVKFFGLSKTSRVKIYTLSGVPVRELTDPPAAISDMPTPYAENNYYGLFWDLKSEGGSLVADGIYVYVITDAGGSAPAIGKLVILYEK